MTDSSHKDNPRQQVSQLQEAIDTIVQAFSYPSSMTMDYEVDGSTKQTRFEVTTSDGCATYKLVYDGMDDDAEPSLSRIE
jgi:hypothetical protein